MSNLNEPIAKRTATLFRMLSSEHDGEVLNAVRAMKRLFATERLTFHDIATVIEGCNGEIEERKYSDSDAQVIFARGVEKGRAEEARLPDAPPEFYDTDGKPRWNEIALFCQKETTRLRGNEREFVDDMVGQMLWRQPSQKQTKWLLSIFRKLGGHCDAETLHLYR
jgi:hypothetical protein